jgi:hypothetical protein
MNPSPAHIDGFFLGMAHAAKVADGNKSGETSRQVRAIWREMTTLRLMHERSRNRAGRIASRFLPCLAVLAFVAAFEALAVRAIVLESDWQHAHFCKFNQTTNCN